MPRMPNTSTESRPREFPRSPLPSPMASAFPEGPKKDPDQTRGSRSSYKQGQCRPSPGLGRLPSPPGCSLDVCLRKGQPQRGSRVGSHAQGPVSRWEWGRPPAWLLSPTFFLVHQLGLLPAPSTHPWHIGKGARPASWGSVPKPPPRKPAGSVQGQRSRSSSTGQLPSAGTFDQQLGPGDQGPCSVGDGA